MPRWQTLVSIGCALVGVAALLVAWQQPGFPQVPPLPVDTSVWVVNDSRLLVGRINTGIDELDSATALRSASDVLQDPVPQAAGSVLVVDQAKHELQVLDTTTVTLGTRVALPDDAEAQLSGGTLAVADRKDGRLWVGTIGTVGSVDARVADPTATLGALPVFAVSTGGTVFATAAGSDTVLRVLPGTEPTSTELPAGALSLGRVPGGGSSTDSQPGQTPAAGSTAAGDIQVTAVGERAVVLDRGDSSLRVGDRRFLLPTAPDAVLQQPGPAATEVVLATGAGLLGVSLDDGTVRTIGELTGSPAPPVVNGGCVFGAWAPVASAAASPVRALAVCPGEGARPAPIELIGSDTPRTIAFRQRGAAVVLGDSETGRSWVATNGYRPVDNWDDVKPPDPTSDDPSNPNPSRTSEDARQPPPDCTAVPIGAPAANDDRYGIRAGRATVLRVLDNDPSVDCTSVVVDSVSPLPATSGSVAIVAGGSAIQVTVPPTATGQLPPIQYRVGNGLGGSATATALVTVVPAGSNAAPQRVRRSAVSSELNATASYNVLDDFYSPTGDDLYLVSATTDSSDVVSFRPDGTVTYRNTGSGEGTDSSVQFVVSDGVEQAPGTLTVSISAPHSTTPVVYPSFTSAVVGGVAVAKPLRGVVSAAADPVTIGNVQAQAGSEAATARLDPQDGSVAITATEPGSYYFTFEASSGGHAVTGVLRADFVPPNDSSRSVVPMADVAYLAPGAQTVVDPLANDTDPDGQGLAVQQVDLPADAPITAAVVDLHLIQVSATHTPRATVVFDYSVFDGAGTRTGQIRIVPIPAQQQIPPPLASPITASVRAGDAVTISIARFATSQDGSPVTAELDLAQLATLPGRAFSTGDTIRYLAPADSHPGPITFGYTAVAGTSTALQPVRTVSTVTITVTAGDPARNSAPNTPAPVIARVFAGSAISVSVPLAGIDPDGDWVVLGSLEQPENPLGLVAISGPSTMSYDAFGTPGVDRIRYSASDPSGQSVTGEVTVLVVEPGDSARPPIAPDLAVSVRPGASIRIDPLDTVVDPGGQRVALGSPAFTATAGLQVQVDDQSLIVTAPADPTVASLRYTVVNTKGLSASGSVKITVSADAPVPAPVATDVFVKPADLATNNSTVDVDVSGFITNRSGRRDQLSVAVDPLSAGQAAMTGPQTIRITVTAVRQVVAYRITDAYGAGATAFIVVPPQQQLVGPQLIAGTGPIQLDAGQSVDVPISDFVTVGGGRAPAIAADPAPRATQGTAVRTSATVLTLSAPSSAGGPAAVYVPIDDGTGTIVVLSLPVQIQPWLVPPPRLDSTDLEVEAGTSGSVDLAALTTTFDEQQAATISYAAGAGSGGVQVRLDGNVLTVSAAPDVPRGTQIAVPIQVVDGDGRDGKATLTVGVTGSRQPLPTVVDQQIEQGRAGVGVSADLLTGSSDPIGRGLTVGNVTVVEGAAGIAAGPVIDGSTVRLTPAAGFFGTIVVAADVTDGTKDPDRVVTVHLRVAIQDRPSAPGVPALVDGTLTASSVQLAWAPADSNGAAVEGYTVAGNGVRQDCPGSESSCVVTGLTAGTPYVFVVTARNAVGESDPSAPSAAVVPNAAPGTPTAPQAEYVGRGALVVSWTVPAGDFTPVTAMSLQVLQGDSVLEVRDNVSSPAAFDGLDPGAGYRFQVRASNRQGSSDWSEPSAAIVPSGVPSAPSDVRAAFRFDSSRHIDVSWGPPADTGGEPVQGYRLLVDNVEIASGGPDFLSQSLLVTSNDPVSVSVIARNSRGEGPPATGQSDAPFDRPATVSGLTVQPADGSLQLNWNPADSPGRPLDHYDYRVDGGGWTPAGAATSATVTGLTNGTSYSVDVRACNAATDYPDDVRCGQPSAPVTGTPFGGLSDPIVTVTLPSNRASTVRADWTFPAGGHGRPITERTVTVSGAVTADLPPDDLTWSRDIGFGASVTVTVRYCVDGPRDCREVTSKTVSTPTPVPVPTLALAPLTGTCGVPQQYAGEWRTQQDCGSGVWTPAPDVVDLLCRDNTGASYPEVPAGNPLPTPKQRTGWYLTVDQHWYRAAALDPGRATIPSCD